MSSEVPPRLRWACRRGMLELDIFLGNYLEQVYPFSSEEDQALFIKVLHCEDQELFEWLTEKKPVPDFEIKPMIEKIRLYAKRPR